MIRKGSKVSWAWGSAHAQGIVKEFYTRKISKTIKGEKVIRHGKKDNKALLIKQPNGTQVLKLESEINHLKT